MLTLHIECEGKSSILFISPNLILLLFMEEKIIKIEDICPKGYKLDKEKSTLDNLVFIKDEIYESICDKLFNDKNFYYITSEGNIRETSSQTLTYQPTDKNNCTSEKQARKLLAINQLLNVAKYLNGDWQPNWGNYNEDKYVLYFDENNEKLNIYYVHTSNLNIVYFKTKELAQKAVEILGEETIKLALSTDW